MTPHHLAEGRRLNSTTRAKCQLSIINGHVCVMTWRGIVSARYALTKTICRNDYPSKQTDIVIQLTRKFFSEIKTLARKQDMLMDLGRYSAVKQTYDHTWSVDG